MVRQVWPCFSNFEEVQFCGIKVVENSTLNSQRHLHLRLCCAICSAYKQPTVLSIPRAVVLQLSFPRRPLTTPGPFVQMSTWKHRNQASIPYPVYSTSTNDRHCVLVGSICRLHTLESCRKQFTHILLDSASVDCKDKEGRNGSWYLLHLYTVPIHTAPSRGHG
jgi:hypothetical protein